MEIHKPLPKIFADSSNIAEISRLRQLSLISGITTNPIIVAKETDTGDITSYYQRLLDCFPNLPISIQLLDETTKGMISRARTYASLSPQVVIKIPMFGDGKGLEVMQQLVQEGIKTNVTGLVKAEQVKLAVTSAMTARTTGPSYVSLLYGRIADSGGQPEDEISLSRKWLDRYRPETEIITGSIRRGSDVLKADLAGSHIVTVTPKILWEMVQDPQTEKYIQQSQAAWAELSNKRSDFKTI